MYQNKTENNRLNKDVDHFLHLQGILSKKQMNLAFFVI